MRKFCLFLLLLFLCCAVVQAQETSAPTLQTLSAEIHGQLDSLKQQSQHLTEQLLIAEDELRVSSVQVEQLQTELQDLNICLQNTNRKLTDYSTKLTQYEMKLKKRGKIIKWAFALLCLFVLVRVVLLILRYKFNVKLPYLINLLL